MLTNPIPTTSMLIVSFSGLLSTLGPAPALAQMSPPQIEVTSHNAALLYDRAWMTMDSDLTLSFDSSADGPALFEGGARAMTENQDTVQALLKASRQREADWDVEYEMGLFALMPHLGKMRATAKILAGDALRCAQEGDAAGAGERVAAIYRVAKHLDKDTILINALVGMAISNLGNRMSVELAEQGILTPQTARTILDAMSRINPEDPVNLRATVLGERDVMANYFLTHFTGPDAGQRIVRMEEFNFDITEPAPARMAEMDGEALRADLKGFSRFHDHVLEAWDGPDATLRVASIEQRLIDGEYGVFAELLAASFGKMRSNLDTFQTDYANARTTLEKIVNP